MENQEKKNYEAPQIEIIEVEVERGFANSQDLDKSDWQWEQV